MDFGGKCIIFVLAKRREPANTGFSPLFSAKIGQKMGCFTKHVGKSTCLRKISTCFSGFFSGQVGARIDDIDTSKVKRYLFFIPAFFTFQVTTQVAHCGLRMLFYAPRRGKLLVAQGRAKRRPGYCRPSPPFALQGQKRKNQRLLFVHTLHLLYMLLPLQGESAAHCIHHPGRRFALLWAMRRLPLRGAQTASFHP